MNEIRHELKQLNVRKELAEMKKNKLINTSECMYIVKKQVLLNEFRLAWAKKLRRDEKRKNYKDQAFSPRKTVHQSFFSLKSQNSVAGGEKDGGQLTSQSNQPD